MKLELPPNMKRDIVLPRSICPRKWLFDLPSFAVQRGAEAGISQIHDCELDTYGEEKLFFSHRRATHRAEPDSGRLISVITQS